MKIAKMGQNIKYIGLEGIKMLLGKIFIKLINLFNKKIFETFSGRLPCGYYERTGDLVDRQSDQKTRPVSVPGGQDPSGTGGIGMQKFF